LKTRFNKSTEDKRGHLFIAI